MTRFFTLALLALGLAAAPVSVDGVTAAHAQKAKKVNKAKKVSKQSKSVYRGPVKKGTAKAQPTAAKKTSAKAAKEDEKKILFVKPAVRNTNIVLGQARQAVKAGAKGHQLLRDAVVRQHAARKANAAGQPRLAFFLTRASRGLALEAVRLNGLKAEDPTDDGFTPTADDIAGVDEYITAVENENLAPPIDVIANDETIGNDLPEDLGDDDGVVAKPTSGPEVEVK